MSTNSMIVLAMLFLGSFQLAVALFPRADVGKMIMFVSGIVFLGLGVQAMLVVAADMIILGLK